MAQKILAVIAWVAVSTATASAGEIRLPSWPSRYQPLEILDVPVVMDLGFFVRIKDPGPIKLQQQSINIYSGCVNLLVESNFDLRLDSKVVPTGAVPGMYSSSIIPPDVDAPGAPPDTIPVLCVKLQNPDLRGRPGGARNVHVATVVISVAPRP
jgi:hypothetical protein